MFIITNYDKLKMIVLNTRKEVDAMKNSTKRIMSSLMVFIMLLGLVMPVFADGAKDTLQNDDTPETNVTLYVHKLMYMNDNIDKITNNGEYIDSKDFPEGVTTYNPAEYGDVSFTLYQLNTEKFNNLMKENNGNLQSVINLMYNENLTDTGKDVVLDDGVSKTQTTTDPITFDLVIPKSSKTGGYYLLVESKHSAVVAEKAQPMILQLPINRSDETHVYPKNKIDENVRSLTYTKYLTKYNKEGALESTSLEGAKFKLYKGNPGSGEPMKEKDGSEVIFTSGRDGTFTIKGLTPGDYYLVEIASNNVDDLDTNNAENLTKNILASKTAMDNNDNQYAFRVDKNFTYYKMFFYRGNWGILNGKKHFNLDDSMKKIYNTEKVKTSKSSNYKSISKYQDIEYSINIIPPANFAKDDIITIQDTADKDITIDKNSFKVYTLAGNEFTDAQIEVTGDKTNEATIKLTANSFPKVGKPASIQPIILKYKASLNKNAVIDDTKEFKNKIQTSYTINNKHFNEPEDPNKENTVKTYSKSFKKVNDGLWQSEIVKTPLKGAEFVLGREVEDKDYKNGIRIDYYHSGEFIPYNIPAEKDIFTTNEDGILKIDGLSSKDENGKLIKYFVEEVKAPEGYRINDFDKDNRTYFTIDEDNEESIKDIPEIENHRVVDAPMTGYEKATITVAALGTALFISVVALKKDRKKENNQ